MRRSEEGITGGRWTPMKTVLLGIRVLAFGLSFAVVLAAILTTTALAANGKPFLLGRNNAASAVSTLVKQGPGPALRLLVRSGQPPMVVNSQVKVPNLNADKIDGRDSGAFLPNNLYTASLLFGGTANGISEATFFCAEGDIAISGGFSEVEEGTVVLESHRDLESSSTHEGWRVEWKSPSLADHIRVEVTCIDAGAVTTN